jgi:hypothetical protein
MPARLALLASFLRANPSCGAVWPSRVRPRQVSPLAIAVEKLRVFTLDMSIPRALAGLRPHIDRQNTAGAIPFTP